MANITKRTNKDGSASYRIRVFLDDNPGGKQITKSMTWHPPAGMSPAKADKEAAKESTLFEDRVKKGVASSGGKTPFADYAAQWIELAEITPKTREQYLYCLKRASEAIGHISLEKLTVEDVKRFIKSLREDGSKEAGNYAVSATFEDCRKEAGITQKKLSELSGVSVDTIASAAHGKNVKIETANKLCKALNKNPTDVFTILPNTGKLSDRTIKHHHTFVRAVLASAKQARIIPHNVASEFMKPPKLPRSEAKYLTDDEARRFLAAVQEEPDIRKKAAFAVLLFSGVRRGELCGLEWRDINFENQTICVNRASQYQSGRGVTEVLTKNENSEREIDVTQYVVGVLKNYKIWWMEFRHSIGDLWAGEKDRLFIQSDGKPIAPDTINGWLNKFLEKNGFQHITPHNLRHTFCTLQLTAGVDLRTLQDRSGHANASTLLDIYSHAIKNSQKKAAQVMDEVLFGVPIEKLTKS